MTVRRLFRSAWVGLLTAVGVMLVPGSGHAAGDPVPGALTALSFDGQAVTGVLTVQVSGNSTVIDPASVTATVDGISYAVKVTPAATQRRAAVLVVDTSGSMGPSGMKAMREAVAAFLTAVPPDVEVGLVSFAATAGVEVAPTRDRAAVQTAANRLTDDGDTALYDGVRKGLDALGDTGDRSLVLLSDGADRRSTSTAAEVASLIKARGVRTDVIGFNFDSRASAEAVLQGIATAGGGSVASVNDGAAVAAVFAKAARALDAQAAITIPVPSLGGIRPVVVNGTAGGTAFRASGSVDLGAARITPTASITAAEAPTLAGASAPRSGLPWVLIMGLVALFLGILGTVGALLTPSLRTQRAIRIDAIDSYTAARSRPGRDARSTVSESMAQSLVHMGDRVMAGRASTSRTMSLLQRADLAWRPGEWAVLRVVSVIVGVALGLLIFRGGVVGVLGFLLGFLVGLVAPQMLLRLLARRRTTKFERQMPDVLMLLASSLATGFSLPQAMDAVTRDVSEPAAKEFARVMAETRIGSDIESALERMAIRMESENMRWTAMAIGIQRQVGGNLAETLRTTAATLREREVLRRHVRALSAEGRLSAVVLVALPILLFVYEVNVNREYISLLWTSVLGVLMLIVGLVFMVIGIFWISRVVKVEV